MKHLFKCYTIDSSWEKLALDSAVKRRDFHAAKGSKKHWHDKEKGEYTDEYFGSLGHIAFEHHVKQIGLSKVSEFAPLFVEDLSTLPIWDAKILGKTVDIKTIPPDSNVVRKRLLIKLSEFKSLDIYAAVKFWSNTEYSFCGYATGREVQKVKPVSFGFAEAYWFYLDQLPHKMTFNVNGKEIVL